VQQLVPPRARARVGELGDRRQHRALRLLSAATVGALDQLARALDRCRLLRTGDGGKRGSRDRFRERRVALDQGRAATVAGSVCPVAPSGRTRTRPVHEGNARSIHCRQVSTRGAALPDKTSRSRARVAAT